jgi:hypothetical protein
MTVTTDKTVRADQLETELTDAGIDVSNGVGTDGENTGTVFTYNANGKITDLPDSAQRVVDAHSPEAIVDPRIAVIEDMDSISDGDKAALIGLIVG